jgi:hypothetical protein
VSERFREKTADGGASARQRLEKESRGTQRSAAAEGEAAVLAAVGSRNRAAAAAMGTSEPGFWPGASPPCGFNRGFGEGG